jgi:hypothetical protein
MLRMVVIACELEFRLMPPSRPSPARISFSQISKLSESSFYGRTVSACPEVLRRLICKYHISQQLAQLGAFLIVAAIGVH